MSTETRNDGKYISDYDMAKDAGVSVYTLRRRWQSRYAVLGLPPVVCPYLRRDDAQMLINDLRSYRGKYRRRT